MSADHERATKWAATRGQSGRSPCIMPAFPQLLDTADASTHAPTAFNPILGHAPSKAPYSGSWWGGRADRVLPNLYAKQSGHDVKNGVQWINPAAFAPPQPWQWGNSPPYVAFGPGLSNWDMSAQKNFRIPIRGLEAPRLQFRADFLDAPNHFALTNGVATPATIGETRDGGATVSSAGKITSGTGNRIIQLGLRFDF